MNASVIRVGYVLSALFLVMSYIKITKGEAIVVGDSMFPTFKEGEHFNYTRLINYATLRGHVVLVEYGNIGLLKRVIGIGGDIIRVERDKIYVNGVIDTYGHIKDEERYSDFIEDCWLTESIVNNLIITADYIEFEIKPGMCFILGDNRSESIDSIDESVGFIDKKDIYGRVS